MSRNIPASRRRSLKAGMLVGLLSVSSGAFAQSNVLIYGRLDIAIRRITNATSAGDSLTETMPGATTTSRWGLLGSEDLGNGLKATFKLEGGINPDVGTAAQSGRLFGRHATVGLSGSFGHITVGRQISLAYEFEGYNEPFGWANAFEPGFIYDNYVTKRWDNSIRYGSNKFGNMSGALMYSVGENASNSSANRMAGAALSYNSGNLGLNGVVQQTHNAAGVVDHELITFGGHYTMGKIKASLSYMKHQADITIQKNHIWATGINYALTPMLDLHAGVYYDKQTDLDGDKKMVSVMLNYKLSKRTFVYINADRGVTSGGYASNVFDDQGYRYAAGIDNRSSMSVGMRHNF
jgi:predicted porin